MDSLRVVINKVEVGSFSAKEMGLNITWSTKNIAELNSFRTSKIKSIRLPLTKEVNIALKSPADIDSTEGTSQKRLDDIDIYINESQAILGWIKTLKTVIQSNNEYIDLTIKPRERNWIDLFKDFNMNELDLSDQDHELTVANIRASETADPSRIYCYAPVDIGEIGRRQVLWGQMSGADVDFYYLGEDAGTFTGSLYGFENTNLNKQNVNFNGVVSAFWNGRGIYIARLVTPSTITDADLINQYGYLSIPVAAPDQTWQAGDLYPSISIKSLIQRAFKEVGYKSNLIKPDLWVDDDYHFWHNPTKLAEYDAERLRFKVKVTIPYCITTFSGVNPIIMPFRKVNSFGYLTNSKYNDLNSNNQANVDAGTNTSKFTADESCILKFRVFYDFLTGAGGSYTLVFSILIKQYDSGNTLRRTQEIKELTMSDSGVESETGEAFSSYFKLNSGDYVTCELYATTITGSVASIVIKNTCTFESYEYNDGNFKGKSVRLNEYLPERTAYDWIKDIALKKNLQFYTSEQTKSVYIVPDDLRRTGKKVDWRGKLNRLRDVELEEIGPLHPKTYNFNWKKDSNDLLVDNGEVYSGERFASGSITNTNVFTTEIDTKDMGIYSPTHNKEEQTNSIYFECAEMYGEDKLRTDYEPRYLKILFDEDISDHSYDVDGETVDVEYSIEGDTPTSTFLYATFPREFWWDELITTYYRTMVRRILHGWILRSYCFINDVDVDGFANILEEGNDFRADYWITLKGIESESELLKVEDYSPANPADTRVELIVYREDL